MAVETTVTSANFIGTGASASYSPHFYVNSSDQVKVYVDGALQTIGDDYTVADVGVSTGCTVVANFALGAAVYIERQTPITQLVDTQNNETILEDVLDAEFDKLTMIAQEVSSKAGRALLFPKGEVGQTLPAAAARVNKFLAFGASGEALAVVLTGGVAPIGTVTVSSRVVLANLQIIGAGQNAWLSESGKSGMFEWRTGDFTAQVTSDPLQGLYVPSVLPGSGATAGCWVRAWDGVNGKPEWFDSTGGTDFLAAFNAIETVCPVALLTARDYPISDTWTIQTENFTVRGSARFNRTSGTGSRITMAHATKDIIRVGYTTQPSGSPEQDAVGGGFLKNVKLENFAIWRTAAPAKWGNISDPTTVGAGLRVKYVLKCHFRDLLVQNSALGVYAGGTIYAKFDDVEARIDIANTSGNYDTNRGWYLDGAVSFGYAGGNASIYLNRCVGVAGRKDGGTAANDIPIGLVAKGSFVDSFIDHFEVAGTSKGMVFDGTGAGTFGTVDLEISHPIIDQYDTIGIEINNIGQAAIELIVPYIAWSGAGTVGLLLSSGSGVTVMGGQIIGGAGLLCASLNNSEIIGLKTRECSAPAVLTACEGVEVSVSANNRTTSATQAIDIVNSKRCPVRLKTNAALAAPGNFTYGINIDTASTNCTLDVTGVLDGNTTDRIRMGGAGGSGVPHQGRVGTHTVINPGASPCAFQAADASGQSTSGTALRTITWSSEIADYTNDFDPATGVFTAPFDGLFAFSWSLMHTNGVTLNDRFDIILAYGGASISTTYKVPAADYNAVRGSATVYMTKGQTAALGVQRVGGTGVFPLYNATPYNSFMGSAVQ